MTEEEAPVPKATDPVLIDGNTLVSANEKDGVTDCRFKTTPMAPLESDVDLVMVITNGNVDANGNPLAADFGFGFGSVITSFIAETQFQVIELILERQK